MSPSFRFFFSCALDAAHSFVGLPLKAQSVPVGASQETTEVVVRGRSSGENFERGVEAVQVIELEGAHAQSADLGTLLSRSSALGVQRTGALGSMTRITMNGLSGDRVPVFIDGLPIAYAGFVFGAANVPVNLLDRIEIYQGVVPVRFAADALTGALNLVTENKARHTGLAASYQGGSFETHRATLDGSVHSRSLGAFAQVSSFIDTTENNYPIDVPVTQSDGTRQEQRVRRFHDAYKGYGARLATGFVDRPWAERLALVGYINRFEKQIQNSASMDIPYGEVEFGKRAWGSNLTYRARPASQSRVEIAAGYNEVRTDFVDVGSCRYGWQGNCLVNLPIRGEIEQFPIDRRLVDRVVFLRPQASVRLHDDHEITFVSSASLELRRGDDAELSADEYDTLNTPQGLLKSVTAASFQSDVLDGRWSNVAFGKLYQQLARTQELLGTGERVDAQQMSVNAGAGDALRVLFTRDIYAKASYEYATRLPNLEEVFGDGALTMPNLSLEPERSHNVNLGGAADGLLGAWGKWRLEALGSYRAARELITRTTNGSFYEYQNVGRVRSLAGSGSIALDEINERAGLLLQGQYQDVRNRSREGALAQFFGDRLVNQPYLTAVGQLYVAIVGVAHPRDRLSFHWTSQYTHAFFRSWESAGDPDSKAKVPSQMSHDASVVYVSTFEHVQISNALEVDNLTNAELYDFYGVVRPGRSVQYKLTVTTL